MLKEYIEREILPRYDAFDAAHRRDHADYVIRQSLELAKHYGLDPDMVYVIAAYHDTGLVEDRKTHHLVSGRLLRGDSRLREWFSEEQIEIMAQAVEDHRASNGREPRSIYGRIVAEADRQIDAETIIRRTVQFGMTHYPELDREGHWQRMLDHMAEKYAEGGYLKLWIPESPNAARLAEFRRILKDRKRLRALFDKFYDMEANNLSCMNKALLFDFDGVVVDSEHDYSIFWDRMGLELLGEEHFGDKIKGSTLTAILANHFSACKDVQADLVAKLDDYEANMPYPYIPGVMEFVRKAREAGFKTAIVTSSNQPKMNSVYKIHPELKECFDHILTSEDFEASKPDPDCFLKAMERCGSDAAHSVVFEDSINGLKAGKASGSLVIGLTTTVDREVVAQYSNLQIDDFSGVDAILEYIQAQL